MKALLAVRPDLRLFRGKAFQPSPFWPDGDVVMQLLRVPIGRLKNKIVYGKIVTGFSTDLEWVDSTTIDLDHLPRLRVEWKTLYPGRWIFEPYFLL